MSDNSQVLEFSIDVDDDQQAAPGDLTTAPVVRLNLAGHTYACHPPKDIALTLIAMELAEVDEEDPASIARTAFRFYEIVLSPADLRALRRRAADYTEPLRLAHLVKGIEKLQEVWEIHHQPRTTAMGLDLPKKTTTSRKARAPKAAKAITT